jgi:hypothetical protein
LILRGGIGNYSIRYNEGDGNVREEFLFGEGMDISAFSYGRDTSDIVLPYGPMSVELVFPAQQGVDIRDSPSRLVKASVIGGINENKASKEVNKSRVFNLKDFMDNTRMNKTGTYHEMWVGE